MEPNLRVGALPRQWRKPVREVCRKILRSYPNTVALVVIGSVALGSWEPDSDVDVVWVVRGRRRKKWHDEVHYDYSGPVEFVALNRGLLRKHLAWRSPMAHSIRRGVVLHDPEGVVKALKSAPLGPPSREWMIEWFDFFWRRLDWGADSYRRAKRFHKRFCREKCTCQVTEILTRAVVNLALILITTRGIVPNCKAEIRLHYPSVISGERRRRAMDVALKAHHEKRELGLEEAGELIRLGRWLRARLVPILGKPKSASQRAATRQSARSSRPARPKGRTTR